MLGLILGPSGCSGPAPKPPPVVVKTSTSTEYYPVRGMSAAAIFEEIDKNGLLEKSGQRAIVLYYPSVRDEPETSPRPRHAFRLASTLTCASQVFAAGKDFIATPAIQGPLWQSFIANGQLVEWHFFSEANHGFRHPDNAGFHTTPISPGRS